MHFKVVHMGREDWSCNQCSKCFGTRSDLTRHMKCHIRKSTQYEFCEQNFGHNFKEHILSGHSEQKLECHLCEKRFPDQKMVEVHIERHNPSKLYQCDVCNKQFKQNSTLKVHMRLHIQDNQIVCDKCPKRFISIRRLKEHNESVHVGKNVLEIYMCNTCERTFQSKRS